MAKKLTKKSKQLIAKRLRLRAEMAGLLQQDIAERTGLSISTMSQMFNGYAGITITNMLLVHDVIKGEMDWVKFDYWFKGVEICDS